MKAVFAAILPLILIGFVTTASATESEAANKDPKATQESDGLTASEREYQEFLARGRFSRVRGIGFGYSGGSRGGSSSKARRRSSSYSSARSTAKSRIAANVAKKSAFTRSRVDNMSDSRFGIGSRGFATIDNGIGK